MKAFQTLICLTLFCCPAILAAQDDGGNPIEKRQFYRTGYLYGAQLHTSGYGGYYRKSWRQTGFSNKIVAFDLISVKHPKEFRISPHSVQQARNYIFGKINSVAFVRPSIGWDKVIFDKEIERGVRVSYNFLFGPTLGLVKPVFLLIENEIPSLNATVVRASYDVFANEKIIGRSNFIRGISETSTRIGMHLKYSLTFEFSKDDESIKALETGIVFDGFLREIEILTNTYNNQFFLNLYISYHLGKRQI